jgi:hypothetical protein
MRYTLLNKAIATAYSLPHHPRHTVRCSCNAVYYAVTGLGRLANSSGLTYRVLFHRYKHETLL